MINMEGLGPLWAVSPLSRRPEVVEEGRQSLPCGASQYTALFHGLCASSYLKSPALPEFLPHPSVMDVCDLRALS